MDAKGEGTLGLGLQDGAGLEPAPKLARNPSFSSNGLLAEAGDEEVDDMDIDRIGHLKVARPRVGGYMGGREGGMTGSKSLASLDQMTDLQGDEEKDGKGEGPATATTLTLTPTTTGLVSTHITTKGLTDRVEAARGGLASKSSSREGSVSGSRPGSSHRRPGRMLWMSTGLCTHSLTIGLFTRWNLHKITFVVSGVESIVVTAQDREGINNVVKPQQCE